MKLKHKSYLTTYLPTYVTVVTVVAVVKEVNVLIDLKKNNYKKVL